MGKLFLRGSRVSLSLSSARILASVLIVGMGRTGGAFGAGGGGIAAPPSGWTNRRMEMGSLDEWWWLRRLAVLRGLTSSSDSELEL